MQILLLATAVLAAPTKNDDPKKTKRYLLLNNFGVSSYAIPYNYVGYPFGLSMRVFGAQVPLSNSLILAYPYGLEYEDLLYRRHFGNIIGSNELALAAAFAQPTRFVSDVSALPPILSLQVEQGKAVNVQVPSSTPQPVSTTTKSSNEDI